jgi:hypothetical protein
VLDFPVTLLIVRWTNINFLSGDLVGDGRWSSLANNNFNYSYCQNKLGYWGNLIHLVSLAFFLSWIELGFAAIIVKKCVYRFRMQLNVWRNQQMKISLAWWRPSKDVSIDSHPFFFGVCLSRFFHLSCFFYVFINVKNKK